LLPCYLAAVSNGDAAEPLPRSFTAINQMPRSDGSGWAIGGFAYLSLNQASISIQYVNEDGSEWQSEVWTRKTQ